MANSARIPVSAKNISTSGADNTATPGLVKSVPPPRMTSGTIAATTSAPATPI